MSNALRTAAIVSAVTLCISVYGYYELTKDSKQEIVEQFQELSLQDQQDFILAMVQNKHSIRREIAEDWCAINKKTQRVCWNAQMANQIRGVK